MPSVRLAVLDITQRDPSVVMGGVKADVVYCDPPWGPGNLKYWRTINKQTVVPDWPVFLGALARTISDFSVGPAFVEMGLRWSIDLVVAMSAVGWHEVQRWVCLYGSPKRPNVLHLFSARDDAPPIPEPGATGKGGEELVRWALTSVGVGVGSNVLDPCTGLGTTLKVAHQLGANFFGSELNPARAAKALQRIKEVP